VLGSNRPMLDHQLEASRTTVVAMVAAAVVVKAELLASMRGRQQTGRLENQLLPHRQLTKIQRTTRCQSRTLPGQSLLHHSPTHSYLNTHTYAVYSQYLAIGVSILFAGHQKRTGQNKNKLCGRPPQYAPAPAL